MKLVKYLLLIIFIWSKITVYGQTTVQDTTFLLRDIANDNYHVIFIDNNRKSSAYDSMADFKFDHLYDSVNYASTIEQNPNLFIKYNLEGLPRQWCPLYYYRGRYYVYLPSGYFANELRAFSDSTYINYHGDNEGEGPQPGRIKSFTKINSKIYHFSIERSLADSLDIIIHIIDKQKGIAVFDYLYDEYQHGHMERVSHYLLMISASKIRNFPIIVNYSKYDKGDEFKFTDPDFKQILKNKTGKF